MPSSTTPRVSVLMTTYNTGELVCETIEAILGQTLTDWELVIVDDYSTDNTPELIQGYHDPRIRFYRNETNLGISHTRNKAIDLARGAYIAATDHDDISLPERLQRQVAYLDAHPEVVLVATAAKELRDGRLRSMYQGEMRAHVLAWRLYTHCSIVHSSICYRREVIERHGIRYRPEYHYSEDFVLFGELSELGDIRILPEELVIYREMAANASSQNAAAMNRHGISYLHERYRHDLGLSVRMEEMEQLWQLFNARSTAANSSSLIETGELYARALEQFLEIKSYPNTEAREVRQFACQDWWRVVRTFCSQYGRFDALSLYRSIPGLSGWQPGMGELGKTHVKSTLRRIRSFL